MTKQRVIYLVGAGPGDTGLITVKGLALVQEADVLSATSWPMPVSCKKPDQKPKFTTLAAGQTETSGPRKKSTGFYLTWPNRAKQWFVSGRETPLYLAGLPTKWPPPCKPVSGLNLCPA